MRAESSLIELPLNKTPRSIEHNSMTKNIRESFW
jgi:hypothetical protein